MDIGEIVKEGERAIPGYTPPQPGQPLPQRQPQQQPATKPEPVKTPEKVPA